MNHRGTEPTEDMAGRLISLLPWILQVFSRCSLCLGAWSFSFVRRSGFDYLRKAQ